MEILTCWGKGGRRTLHRNALAPRSRAFSVFLPPTNYDYICSVHQLHIEVQLAHKIASDE